MEATLVVNGDGADEVGGAAAREYWRDAVRAGGFTPMPGWAAEPGDSGTGEIWTELDGVEGGEGDGIGGTADVTAPLLLAAHAKVVAALTGDRETITGFQPAGGSALMARVTVDDGSWHELTETAAATLRAIRGFAAHAPHTPLPLFEALAAERAADLPVELPRGVVLGVAVDGARLLVRHRADVLDATAARRVAGYYATALRRAVTEPDAPHHARHLLGEEELRFQWERLAGPERPLPDRRFHELFEEQARLRPDAVAVVHGTRSLTYGELNRQANRVAWQLRHEGLWNEDVVAVVTERDLDWAAAVIGVFKAGGAYLPVEPHFPASRVEAMLRRSGCRLVLTAGEVSPTLTEAVAAIGDRGDAPAVLRIDELPDRLADHDPRFPVAADALAYIYFTSGSTGEPKGAMCEHAGFVNHLLAKIEDLEITADTTVAQTAPQCFDISLWQLVSALAVGGRTHIIEQEAVLEIGRFTDILRSGRIHVVQLVPSYLEVLLTYLEGRTGPLPDLRMVSATGEALKKELVERWFAAFPQVPLTNAYGLTETSDDTNHEVMRKPPEGPSVPLGRPVRNVRVQVVDERLRPVPAGAPGEIVFHGVCVGRGYVNDEERTRAAFLPDPAAPGHRVYRSGDFGRWAPDGRLEFHGRRDAQMKIRGFRIEIGEIEDRMMRADGVRDAAVVAVGSGDERFLVGHYTTADGGETAGLRDHLAAALPSYMVPARLVRVDAMPLTANGKIDKKELARRAAGPDAAAPGTPAAGPELPATDTERRLAELWSAVLKVPAHRIARDAHFFELGGTSLTAVRLAIGLDRLVTVAELAARPVLADLAELVDARAAEPSRRAGGALPAAV
ncbi:non-ribosomal peptide synthetase [Streptomyces sp. XD-27]|uniref:non-ribosomal peptide synthetase n=1 Tax=Streptomyces sp. XD-27 TaxID=3062779 RepID=UPI0026F47117|nr:non-ribosomal peptide synthetase [Streptomyces sp. XD-27]WKX69502.1 non-ribosomal peptide synthetase [Streptomyces sp. XD-27]